MRNTKKGGGGQRRLVAGPVQKPAIPGSVPAAASPSPAAESPGTEPAHGSKAEPGYTQPTGHGKLL